MERTVAVSLHLLDMRSIKDFARDDKFNLAVSIAQMPNGTPSVVSRYGDVVWDFYPYIPQENLSASQKRIDWRVLLSDGRLLTDPEHAALLESTKDFIWSLFSDPVEGRKRPVMFTLCSKLYHTRPLLNWMISVGLTRFADLAGRTLEYVPHTKISIKGTLFSPKTTVLRLTVVEDLYHQRDKLNDALPVHPWPHESACSLAGKKQDVAHRKPQTEVIPDVVASRLTEAALDYIQRRSVKILAAIHSCHTAEETLVAAGKGQGSKAWARTTIARDSGFDGAADLTTEAGYLRTACYIVIAIFSGIRDSEMMSIALNCIAHGKSRDGSTDLLWLHGTLYKTGMRSKKWLVPPVVKEAVDVLTRLTAPFHDKMRQEEAEIETHIGLVIATEKTRLMNRLNTVSKHKNKLFLSRSSKLAGTGIAVLAGHSINKNLKRFCAFHGILGEDGQAYPLHTHQFRRTYARFIARSELGDLLTLRDHFGHGSIDMTVYYADGGADDYEVDTELLEMITKEKLSRQNEIMGDYLDSDEPLANGGHWLKEWRSSVRTAANKESLIAEYAGTITLNGTGHSWCVGNAKGTGCGGLCVFEAQMCVDCDYGIIGQEHRPVWQGIHEQQREALALDDMGPGGKARAQNILEYAAKVLCRLDGQEAA